MSPELAGLLAEWMPRQRWFAGKGRGISAVEDVTGARVREGLELSVVRVSYADGGVEDYQLLLGRAEALDDRLDHAAIGEVDGHTVYDAAHDTDATGALLGLLATGGEVDGLSFVNDAEIDTSLTSRPMGAEQSNTSVVFGDRLVLKLFRRLQPGANPDIEVTKALADAGSHHVARPLAWLDGVVEGEVTTLGLLQPFLHGASEGWAMATASVRDLFAEGDLHPDEVGGDFAGESERLGSATGEVHLLMAQVLPTKTVGGAATVDTAAQMDRRLDAALAVVPQLRQHEQGIRAAYARVGELSTEVQVQRVHGDYHLGQVLRTQEGWVLLDFEGEPARPLAERRALMSPLRDVAGMLRSFDYASRHLLVEQGETPQLVHRATEWADRNRNAFCDGYAAAVGADPRDADVLLRAFELDKAVYEVVYEARNRPPWLGVPLGSVGRLVSTA